MNTHLEVMGDEKALHVTVNGAELVVDNEHPLYVELRLIIDHVIKSATRNARRSVAGSLTVDDLIFAAHERLEQLKECKRQQLGE